MIRLVFVLALIAYAVGLHWIYTSLHDFGELPAWLSGLATLLLAAYVAGYATAAAALIKRFRLKLIHPATPWVVAGAVTLFEWIRGWMLTGFPWLSLGYLAIDSPLDGYGPLLGVYGIGFVFVLCIVWSLQVIRYRQPLAFVSLFIVLALGWGLSTVSWTTPYGRPLRVALVQGAIPQSMKFDPAREAEALQTHLQIASVAAQPGTTQLIVFPETAITRPWEDLPPETQEAFARLSRRAEATVMLGAPLRDQDGFRNSLISLTPDTPPGRYSDRYDKHHLVPFGEFIPWGFRWFVDMMNMPLGDFQRGAMTQKPFQVGQQRIGVNICFEDLFGEEIIRPLSPDIPAQVQPTILLNVSNLAWFGDSIALSQHLNVSRMRAIETGRPMIRATNTGATAAIDAKGRVIDQLPFSEPGLLSTQVQGMQGITPYSRSGNLPVLGLVALGLGLGFWGQRKRKNES